MESHGKDGNMVWMEGALALLAEWPLPGIRPALF